MQGSVVAELLKGVAWPVVVLASLTLFRKEVRALLGKLTEAVGKAARISIGSKGLDITLDAKLAAVNTRVTVVQATQEVTKQIDSKRWARRGQAATREGSSLISEELSALSAKYRQADGIDSRKERVRQKNDIAAEMGAVAVGEGIQREVLVDVDDEVMLAAFASMVIATPGRDDLRLLLKSAQRAKRLHIRYRLVLALAVLINKGFVEEADRQPIAHALDAMEQGADPSLKNLIHDTNDLLAGVFVGYIQLELGPE